ncbi:MAG: hypothetical protein HQK66_07540 [Desulfamplus sp.]|nr:hypothetical protein [Desulfamplus sp.]
MIPLLVPALDGNTNKFTGKSVIADSMDNSSSIPNQQFRDRIYYYDLALNGTGKAYVLYADPKPLIPDSDLPVDLNREKTDIVLAIETATGWDKQVLCTEGVFQPAALQIEIDGQGVFHLIYIRKLTKEMAGEAQVVDYLVYRKLENDVLSEEIEVGDLSLHPPNLAGLGGWRTRMALTPDDRVYMLREGGSMDLTRPVFNLLVPDGSGNWDARELSGLPAANWYRLGGFLIDKAGHPHIIFADYAYDNAGQPYIADGFSGLEDSPYHNLWYAGSDTLDGQGWTAIHLDEDPGSSVPSLYQFQFWVDLALDEDNNPAVATWLWRVGTLFPGYNTSAVFFRRDSTGQWHTSRTTRTFENLTYEPQGPLAGMGPGLVKDASGWHGVWDSSHPRPFEHEFQRGGIMYRFSPDGDNWNYYQPLAPFSAEGHCITKIDAKNRLNVLVLGDHTDTQLYLLRYQLPGDNLMEVYTDRRYYYKGESVTLHARIEPGAVGDYYVAAVSTPRPEIHQNMEIWQLTDRGEWQKITGLEQLLPLLTVPEGFNFHNAIGTVGPLQSPFDKPDTDYTIFSLVTEPGSDINAGQWVTPLFAREITVNKGFPQ